MYVHCSLFISMLCFAFLYLNFEPLCRHIVQSSRLKKEQMAQPQMPLNHQQYTNQPSKFLCCRHFVNFKSFSRSRSFKMCNWLVLLNYKNNMCTKLLNNLLICLYYTVMGAVSVLNQINRNTPSPMSQNGSYNINYCPINIWSYYTVI